MNNKILIWFLVGLFFFACGSIKSKQFQQTNELMERNSHTQTAHTELISKAEIIHDSTNTQYDIEILPVGNFTYDALNGFKGNAKKIIWKGKQQSNVRLAKNGIALKTAKKEALIQNRRKYTKEEQTKIKWSDPIGLWILSAVVILSVWLYLVISWRMKF